MVLVTIQLVSAHGEDKNRMLCVMKISNDGTGTKELGNYNYVLSHAGKYIGKRGVYRKGRIENFPRNASPYRLIQRCLKHAGEI